MDALLGQEWSVFGKKSPYRQYLSSPRGDVFELPQKSTPIDFAYAVHSDVGYHAIWARINGKIRTLDTLLKDGDIVEMVTSTQAHPAAQWLDFVVSSKAKSQIGVEVKRLSGDRGKSSRNEKMLFDTF